MHNLDDTIAAIATAPGGAARGIIRIAGDDALAVASRVFVPANEQESLANVRAACVLSGSIQLADVQRRLDCDLFLWPSRRSYTRSPLVEVHTLGSPPLLQAVLDEVCRNGARVANPGEFTLRAFLAGRIDLTQAEAVLGVIDARGETQLQTALAQLAGGLSAPLDALRNRLLDLLAHLEAGLDFVEEDIEFITAEELGGQLAAAEAQLTAIADQLTAREETSESTRIVLVGDPNVGKSSLYNALVRCAKQHDEQPVEALVSPVSGTTRDYLSARFEVDGHPCELIDTAGLEAYEATNFDSVERRSQQQAESSQRSAQLVLLCFDASRELTPQEEQRLKAATGDDLIVWTKNDLTDRSGSCQLPHDGVCQPPHRDGTFRSPGYSGASPPAQVLTSSETRDGLDELWSSLAERLSELDQQSNNSVGATAARCRESIRLAAESIAAARGLAIEGGQEELVASEVRVALNELGRVVGAVYTDDILDRVFSRFCIGK